MSFSSLGTLHSCERKFLLKKYAPIEAELEIPTPNLVLGSAVGNGYAAALAEDAGYPTPHGLPSFLETWLLYSPNVANSYINRAVAHATVEALTQAPFPPEDDLDPCDWRLGYVNKKPATEIGFAVKLTDDLHGRPVYYIGYLDAILYSPSTGAYRPLELKTTSAAASSPLLFQHSYQALGYALVLRSIMKRRLQTLTVHYRVARLAKSKAQMYKPVIEDWFFKKDITVQLEWLISLHETLNRLTFMADNGCWPQRHTGCNNYGRPCEFFGICDLDLSKTPKLPSKTYEVDFMFDLNEITQDTLKQLSKEDKLC